MRFQDDTFDMVLSTGMLHMLKNPVQVLQECRRVLKPGAAAWIYDPARVSSSIDKDQWKRLLSVYEKFVLKCYRVYAWMDPPKTFDKKQIAEIISRTDFKEYSMEQMGEEFKIKLKK